MNQCILCGREVKAEGDAYCCGGCAAIDEIISTMALEADEKDKKIKDLLSVVFPNNKTQPKEADPSDSPCLEAQFAISGMECPACAWIIHHALSDLHGVKEVSVNFISETCQISYFPMIIGLDSIKEKLHFLGFAIKETDKESFYNYYQFGLGWFLALNAMMFSFVVYSAEKWDVPFRMELLCSILLLVFATITLVGPAYKIVKKGFAQLKTCYFRMESLIFLSTSMAYLYSIYSLITMDFKRLYFDVVCLLLMLVETGYLVELTFYNKIRKRLESSKLFLPKK